MRIFLTSLITLFLSSTCLAQKEVAVVTFYTPKTVEAGDLSGVADFIIKNTELSEDPNFNLKAPLQKFHDAFFKDYVNNFKFKIIDESTVLANETYKSFDPAYKKFSIDVLNKEYETIDDYKIILPQNQVLTNKKMLPVQESLEADGLMYVSIGFRFLKTTLGKYGYASIQAYTNITLYDSEGKSVFDFHEVAGSKKKVAIVNGIPVMKPEKIQPMCESAIEELMKDMNKKLARLVKKSNRKF